MFQKNSAARRSSSNTSMPINDNHANGIEPFRVITILNGQKGQQGYKITLRWIPFSCVSLMLRSLRPAFSCISRTSTDCFLKQRNLSSYGCWSLCISRSQPVFIVWLSIRGRSCCSAHCLAPSPTRKLGWTTEIISSRFSDPASSARAKEEVYHGGIRPPVIRPCFCVSNSFHAKVIGFWTPSSRSDQSTFASSI